MGRCFERFTNIIEICSPCLLSADSMSCQVLIEWHNALFWIEYNISAAAAACSIRNFIIQNRKKKLYNSATSDLFAVLFTCNISDACRILTIRIHQTQTFDRDQRWWWQTKPTKTKIIESRPQIFMQTTTITKSNQTKNEYDSQQIVCDKFLIHKIKIGIIFSNHESPKIVVLFVSVHSVRISFFVGFISINY